MYLLIAISLAMFDMITAETSNVSSVFKGCADVKLITYTTPYSQLLTGLPFTGPAINLALDEIRAQYGFNLTNDYITRNDLVNCDDMFGSTYLVAEYYYRQPKDTCLILLNPGCDDEIPLGRLSTEWNMPILTSGTIYPIFYKPEEFPTMASFGGVDLQQLTQGLFDIFRYFLWISVAVIHDVSPAVSAVYPGIVRLLKQNVAPFSRFTYFPIDTSIVNGTVLHGQIIQQIRPISRVVLMLIMADQSRAFMINAQKIGKLAEEFVFICAEPFHSVRRLGDLVWQTGDQDDQIARTGFRSLLHLTGSCGVSGNNPEQPVLDYIKSEGIVKYNADYMANEETNEISMSAYYSVKTLGDALYDAAQKRVNMRDGRAFASLFSSRTFRFNGRPVIMNPARVRMFDYCLRDLDLETGNLQPVMTYDALSRKLQPIANRTIDWNTPGNVKPMDVPKCGYLGDNPICQAKYDLKIEAKLIVVPKTTRSKKDQGSWGGSMVVRWAAPLAVILCIAAAVAFWWIHYRTWALDNWWMLVGHDLGNKPASRSARILSEYRSLITDRRHF